MREKWEDWIALLTVVYIIVAFVALVVWAVSV